MNNRFLIFLFLLFFWGCSRPLEIKGDWISYQQDFSEEHFICSFEGELLKLKEIKLLVENPIVNRAFDFRKVDGFNYVSEKDTITLLEWEQEDRLTIFNRRTGDTIKMRPLATFNQGVKLSEIKNALTSNLLSLTRKNKTYVFDLNEDGISMDGTISTYDQFYYLELYKNELFVVLTDMFGPIIHVEHLDSNEVAGRVYDGSGYEEMLLVFSKEENEEMKEKLYGMWTKDSFMEKGKPTKDTIKLDRNGYVIIDLFGKRKGKWDVFHNGKFLGFKEWHEEDRLYGRPEKSKIEYLDEKTILLNVPVPLHQQVYRGEDKHIYKKIE